MMAISGLDGAVRFLKASFQVMIRLPTLSGDLRHRIHESK